MRVLFDEGTPIAIARFLAGHPHKTAYQMAGNRLTNGELLRVAEEAGFDVLLTTDKNIVYQQNLRGRQIAIVVLGRNSWRLLKPMIAQITAAVNAARGGSYSLVQIPDS